MSTMPRKQSSVGDRVEVYSSTAQRWSPGQIVDVIDNGHLVSVDFNCAGLRCRKSLSMSSPHLVVSGAESEADSDCSQAENECDPDGLFEIQPSITEDHANALQGEIQDIFYHKVYPPVVISYATGRRRDVDGKGAGPGLMWAQSLQKALFEEGIPSFTGLLIKGGMNWERFKLRIAKRNMPICKVIIEMLSKAYFNSFSCLDEVCVAASAKVPVLPLRFEDPLPDKREWWPTDDEPRELQVAQATSILQTNCLPARGGFCSSTDACLQLQKFGQGPKGEVRRRSWLHDALYVDPTIAFARIGIVKHVMLKHWCEQRWRTNFIAQQTFSTEQHDLRIFGFQACQFPSLLA
eukprot:TRINITY_DN3264_c0_g3_i1.p2 TRINITY_DN3264_c0_g3~~TRINITY_DN3264_c0_g3_i1.p2  ORF type:complete len:350 (+),score=56.65 TRINITY_DN3264_c0_g3_i1:51-1100(+)